MLHIPSNAPQVQCVFEDSLVRIFVPHFFMVDNGDNGEDREVATAMMACFGGTRLRALPRVVNSIVFLNYTNSKNLMISQELLSPEILVMSYSSLKVIFSRKLSVCVLLISLVHHMLVLKEYSPCHMQCYCSSLDFS